MAFAAREQLYEISNGLHRIYAFCRNQRNPIRNSLANEGIFHVSDELEILFRWADKIARTAYDAMISWNDVTRISNEIYMNNSTPNGVELPRLARTDIPLRVYESYRELMFDLMRNEDRLVEQINEEYRALLQAPAVPPAPAAAGPPGSEGQGKPHMQRGEYWHAGQNRR
jgi:hypothetical protein